MKQWLGQTYSVFDKEVRIEWRTRSMLLSMTVFGLLVLFIFGFAFPPDQIPVARSGPGILWVAFLFANLLGLTRTMARERENGCLEAQLLAPVDRLALYLGKFCANLLFLLVVEGVMVLAFFLFFHVELSAAAMGWLALVIFLGSVGLISVGTLLSAMAVETRLAEVLFSLMMTPLVLPVLLGAVKATEAVLSGQLDDGAFWFRLLLAADGAFLIVSGALYGQVLDR